MLSKTRIWAVLLVLLIVSYFPTLVSSAFVQPYSCQSDLKPLSHQDRAVITNPVASVAIKDNFIYYRLDFSTAFEINDVNYTTNLYTTLIINSKFMNGEVFDKSVRLCEYVRPVNESSILDGGAAPDFSGLPSSPDNSTSDNFTINDNSSSTGSLVPWPSASNIPPLISKRDDYKNGCPLYPNQPYEIIFAANTGRTRYFGSYETTFTFFGANSKENNEIGCFQVYATPYHPTYITYPICFGVMAIFIIGFITNFYIFHFSPHQESDNVFLTVASSICNGPLLNELTPDITMLLNFLQFVLFACALDLTYPGFLQPIISYLNWVALIRIDIFSSKFINALSEGGVYKTLGRKGIYAIFPEGLTVPDGVTSSNIWKNFMVWSWVVVGFFIILNQSFIAYRQHKTKNYKISGWKSRLYFAFGSITQFFYVIFPLPFVSISCFLILEFGKGHAGVQRTASSFCIIFLVIWLIGISYFSIKYVLFQRNKLYSSFNVISCWSSLYYWYKPECSFFLILKQIIILFQGVVIGCGQYNGIVQVSLLMFIEIVHILLLLYFQPYFNKIRNAWSISIAIASLIILSFNIAYIRDLYVQTKVRGILGDLQLLLCAIIILAFFICFLIRATQVSKSIIKKKGVDLFEKRPIRHQDRDESTNDTTLEPEQDEIPKSEFDFEEPCDYQNFPRPRLEQQLSRQDSITSDDSSIVELTDQRVLPGISLNYLHSKEYLPAPVSPIDDEFLANLSKNDSELRNLWAKRNNPKRASRFDTKSSSESNSMLNLKKTKSSIDGTYKKGFQVVGRKPIIVTNGNSVSPSTSPSRSPPRSQKKKGFVVVGRKPILVNHGASKADHTGEEEDDEE